MELYIPMEKGADKAWAYYNNFKVGDAASKYTLSVSRYWDKSTAGDSFLYQNGS